MEDTEDQPSTTGKRTVEDWARDKGMFPEMVDGKKSPVAPKDAPPPLVHNAKFAAFHRANVSLKWPIGMELTEAEFDKAVADAEGHIYR